MPEVYVQTTADTYIFYGESQYFHLGRAIREIVKVEGKEGTDIRRQTYLGFPLCFEPIENSSLEGKTPIDTMPNL